MTDTRDPYTRQAPRYDTTRGASPAVLGPVLAAIDGAPGVRLLDVRGGTGNYAAGLRDRDWQVTIIDRSPSMLASAGAKDLATVQADATVLPSSDQSADAVTMLSMLHQLSDRERREPKPGGCCAQVDGWR